MCGTRLIITKVRLMDCNGESLPEKGAQRHHVGLFHDLSALRPLASERHIDGNRHRAVGLEVEVLQIKKASKLLEQIGRGIEPRDQERRGPAPGFRFIGHDLQALADDRPDLRMARAEPVDRVRGPLQGPLRHDVGVRIVIHGLMVLIRTDDRSNVIPPVWLYPATSGPESRGFDENVHAGCEEKSSSAVACQYCQTA